MAKIVTIVRGKDKGKQECAAFYLEDFLDRSKELGKKDVEAIKELTLGKSCVVEGALGGTVTRIK